MAAEASPRIPLTRLCVLLSVSRSSHYRWRGQVDRPPTATQQQRQTLALVITMLFLAHHQRPGRRPMQQLLATAGYAASLGRIDRLMRELGLQARRNRHRRRAIRPGPSPALTAHITNHCRTPAGTRDFTSDQPGRKTVGDITQLPTAEGPHYLATVLDLATRRVLGWATAAVPDATLPQRALTVAVTHQVLAPAAIFHSDRGPQYTSHPFQDYCAALAITQSMGATGSCYDNAVAEAFFATLKGDLASELPRLAPATEVLSWLARWIDDWYNPCRPHAANGGLAPITAWNRLVTKIDPVPDS